MTLLLPEFAQASSYSAKRWRRAMERYGRSQPGVLTDGFVTTKDGSGWGYTVSGGRAYVGSTFGSPANVGLYHVEADSTPLTGTVAPAHATLPRVDAVVIRVNDTTDNAGASDNAEILTMAGTATSGATLGNRTGAASLTAGPGNILHIADILVPGGAGSIAAATVRDRRTWAHGVFHTAQLTSGDVSISSGVTSELAAVRLNVGRQAGTSSSNILQFGFTGAFANSFAQRDSIIQFQSQTVDSGTWTQIGPNRFYRLNFQATTRDLQVTYIDAAGFSPANMQFRISATAGLSTLTARRTATTPLRWWVREIPQVYTSVANLNP